MIQVYFILNKDLWCLYAKVYIMKKIYSFATPLLEKALELDPQQLESKELLENIQNIDSD